MATRPATARAPTWKQGSVTQWLVTLDHKRIGVLYIVSAFFFFFTRRDHGAPDAHPARPGRAGDRHP